MDSNEIIVINNVIHTKLGDVDIYMQDEPDGIFFNITRLINTLNNYLDKPILTIENWLIINRNYLNELINYGITRVDYIYNGEYYVISNAIWKIVADLFHAPSFGLDICSVIPKYRQSLNK